MINLLPADIKEDYRFARHNSRLIGWVVAFGFALAGLAAISVGGIFYLKQTTKPYYGQVASAQASLQAQDQTGTEKQVNSISNNLKLVIQVLSKEILFSQLLKQLAIILPANTTLSNLDISQAQGALNITANTVDYNAATQLQVNLSDPNNKIFSQADILSINCASVDETASDSSDATSALKSKYPCTVTISALFAPNNPFLFISSTKTPAKAVTP